jgi:hypothetical protein
MTPRHVTVRISTEDAMRATPELGAGASRVLDTARGCADLEPVVRDEITRAFIVGVRFAVAELTAQLIEQGIPACVDFAITDP